MSPTLTLAALLGQVLQTNTVGFETMEDMLLCPLKGCCKFIFYYNNTTDQPFRCKLQASDYLQTITIYYCNQCVLESVEAAVLAPHFPHHDVFQEDSDFSLLSSNTAEFPDAILRFVPAYPDFDALDS